MVGGGEAAGEPGEKRVAWEAALGGQHGLHSLLAWRVFWPCVPEVQAHPMLCCWWDWKRPHS